MGLPGPTQVNFNLLFLQNFRGRDKLQTISFHNNYIIIVSTLERD